MNPATEIVLRWLFSDSGLEDELSEELISVLRAGTAAREPDSIKAVSDYVEQARTRPKEAPYDEIIRIALLIHDELVQVNVAAENLERFQQIDKLLTSMPTSSIGKRVVAVKIKTLISELQV